MGRVYKTAKNAIAWIGPEEDNSIQALAIIERMGRYVTTDWRWEAFRPSDDCPEEHLHWADVAQTIPFKAGELDSSVDRISIGSG
jgi:hypothetical protein